MTEAERDLMIEQRRLLLSNLATIYPAPMAGDKIYHTVLFVYCDYTRHRCMRDLMYFEEKGYVVRRKAGNRDDPAIGEWRSILWGLTAKGLDVNQRLVNDPTLEV